MNVDFQALKERTLQIEKAGDIEKIIACDTPYQRFVQAAAQFSGNIAVKYMGTNIRYCELLKLIDKLANGFDSIGIKKDDVVTVSLLGTPYAIAVFYALDKLGACQHMVNSASGLDELKRELSHFHSKYYVANDIFCTNDVISTLRANGVKKIVTVSLLDGMQKYPNKDRVIYTAIEKSKGIPKNIMKASSDILTCKELIEIGEEYSCDVVPATYEEDHMATVAYTSGSTGNSKACVATWRAIDSFVQVLAMTEIGRYHIGDILFTTFPLWIYYSLLNMLHEPLCLGITVALDPIYKPENLARRNKQYRFHHWPTIPPYISKMVSMNKKMDCSRWCVVSVGGVELTNETKLDGDAYIQKNGGNAKIVQGYGASEVLGSFSYCYYDNPTLGSLGKPCIGNMFKLVDVRTGREIQDGNEGLLYIYSPAMMSEYYGDEESTKASLITDENGAVWYNTEDIMRVNENGELFFVDRLRRMTVTIDSAGKPNKLIPSKTEKCIAQIPGVEECAVITVHDPERENIPIAFVKASPDCGDAFKQEIVEYCKDNIYEYQVPAEVIFVDAMPLTNSQKPDYKELEQQYQKRRQ
ncbi:MAG: acyl--CoA ligase [Ruminococcaceae bacterium]|nr:acyl--CoA ligase [Oscillospiraceae bacterium]